MDSDHDASDGAPRGRVPLIFISHDTRDAELAEAFSRLLSSVSAGVLKSFRSSDKRGNQGIEYGVEWYPEIMKKLESASDVVCLLTPNSVGRPWILYEAGVAKGKLDTPVHGIALGLPLQNASTGPFAQFQNSDDSEDSLTQLVIQLVRRIPGAEPDREVVRSQVASFRDKALPMATASDEMQHASEGDTASVAKIFEEVKVMFQDLPTRIERRLDPDYPPRRRKRLHPGMMLELTEVMGRETPEGLPILIFASQFREEFPWIYELAADVYRKSSVADGSLSDSIQTFERTLNIMMRHPIFREIGYRSKERYFELEEAVSILHELTARARSRVSQRNLDKSGELPMPAESEEVI